MPNKKIAILGAAGVPANYGGFETLAENLVRYHDVASPEDQLTVYCSSKNYPIKKQAFLSARLKYVPLNANGAQSILYDIFSLLSAVWSRNDEILLLGVSGAIALPIVRVVSHARIITNIDGIEWRRLKWRGIAKHFLRFSEKIAVRFSHEVITDNEVITDYVRHAYGVDCHMIAYGGDHAVAADAVAISDHVLPAKYAFSVCRIEPENNVYMIVEAFSRLRSHALIMVGNWDYSDYGRAIREQFGSFANLYLLDPIYDLGQLKTLRSQAMFYVHGHCAGGTNPSLVEAMHFALPVLAFDCGFNRSTAEDKALFFGSSEELVRLVETTTASDIEKVGRDMLEIARRRYTWSAIAEQYFALLNGFDGMQ
ncbi:MAG: DUF1972 domain-containing protein [Deltaproteobacteria bacterium]